MTATHFANKYGMSVIEEQIGGQSRERFEVAVLHNGYLCYKTPITDDVLRYRTFAEVKEIREAIEALPPNPLCAHKRPRPDKEC